jgi:hypothetical protein
LEADLLMGGSWLGWGCIVLALVKDVCDSWDPEAFEVMECDLGSVTACGMKESHCTCGSEMAPEG